MHQRIVNLRPQKWLSQHGHQTPSDVVASLKLGWISCTPGQHLLRTRGMFSFNHQGNPMRCVISVSESRDQVRGSKKDSEMTELAKRGDRHLNLGLLHTRAYRLGGCPVASQSSHPRLSSPQAAPSTPRSFLLFDRFLACAESDLLVRSNLPSTPKHDCTGMDQHHEDSRIHSVSENADSEI